MIGLIYIIKNKINNKVYVGQTWRSLQERFSQHKRDGKCLKLHRAFKKYGKNNFKINLCITAHSQEILDYWECFFIEKYDSIKNGYNIRYGGSRGMLANSTKEKIAKALKGNTNSKDRKLSKIHKQRISKAHKGKKFSENHKEKLSNSHLKISIKNQIKICSLYEEGKSCVDIANQFNCTDGAIRYILSKHNILSKKEKLKSLEPKICDFYKEVQSIKKVALHFNYSEPTISKILKKYNVKVSRKKISKEKEKAIVAMAAKKSIKDLAIEFNCSKWKIRQIIKLNPNCEPKLLKDKYENQNRS